MCFARRLPPRDVLAAPSVAPSAQEAGRETEGEIRCPCTCSFLRHRSIPRAVPDRDRHAQQQFPALAAHGPRGRMVGQARQGASQAVAAPK